MITLFFDLDFFFSFFLIHNEQIITRRKKTPAVQEKVIIIKKCSKTRKNLEKYSTFLGRRFLKLKKRGFFVLVLHFKKGKEKYFLKACSAFLFRQKIYSFRFRRKK